MTIYSQATVSLDGTASVQIQHGKSGIQWIVSQVSVETLPVRGSAQTRMLLNGRYVTSTVLGSGSSAQGPPYINMQALDLLELNWVGLTVGDSAIVTLFYNEQPWGDTSGAGVV